MDEAQTESTGRRLLYGAAALVVVVAGLRAGQSILIPLLLAAFMAVLCIPLLSWLTRHRVPPVLAVVAVVLVAVGALAGVALVVGSSVNDFADRVPFYQQRFKALHTSFQFWLGEQGIPFTLDRLYSAANPGNLMGLVSKALSGLASALSNLLLVLFTVIFILAEAGGLRPKVTAALAARDGANEEDTAQNLARLGEIVANVQRYLAWKTIISLGTGVCVGLLCWILGVDFPFLWALLAFLLNFVPNIGSLISAVPPVLLAIVQLGPGSAVGLAVGYVAINTIFGNVIEPMVMGRKLGLSSLVVFLSLIIWGFVWGPVGMLLSVPLTVIVRIGLEASPRTRWIAVLLGPSPESEKPREKRGANQEDSPDAPDSPDAADPPDAPDPTSKPEEDA